MSFRPLTGFSLDILRTGTRLLLLLALLGLLPAPAAQAQDRSMSLPPGFVEEVVVSGLDGPTAFAFAPDGRIFFTQKAGTVRVAQGGELLPENFIDISYEVNQTADRGLLGIALHPAFPRTPYVYLSYVYEPLEAKGYPDSGARVSRLLRVEADPANTNVHLPGSGMILLGQNSTFANIGNPNEADEPPFSCIDQGGAPIRDCLPAEGTAHTINMIRIGPDGALYVAVGDGTVNGRGNLRAQDIGSLAGKILRINPFSGDGYANNPFYNGDPGSNASKVFALGMRNPFRFAFEPGTGNLLVGEVGNNKWEEISRARPGANLGWPCYEGPEQATTGSVCDPLFNGSRPVTPALFSYPHANNRGAAIGGDFYTGSTYPAAYRGAYFYADYNAGIISYLTFARNGGVQAYDFASSVYGPVQLSMGPDGNLYLLSIVRGTLSRIRYVGGANTPPTALATASVTSGSPPLEVRFSAADSFDSDGDAISFEWKFGDGERSTEPNPTHMYTAEGSYPVELIVSDGRGGAQVARLTISVGNTAPTARILTPAPSLRYRVGDTISFSGEGQDPEDGALPGENLQWEAFLYHNDHVHYDFYSGTGTTGSLVFDDHGDNTFLELCLTVTDKAGLQDRTCTELRPQEVVYTIASQPDDLPVFYAGSPYRTPFKVRIPVGSARTLEVPESLDGGLQFDRWSDGGAAARTIQVGAADRTLTVYFSGEEQAIEDASTAPEEEAPAAEEAPIVNESAPPPRVAETEATPTPAPTPTLAPAPAAAPSLLPGRGILREWWTGVSGGSVADLLDHPAYPADPDGREILGKLEAPRSAGKDYGARLRGYLEPEETGDYQFWIASDDHSELWLSTDESTANRQLIALVPSWTHSRQWDRYPEQASVPVRLEAGQRYYVEVLHKQWDQKDNLAVAWLPPGGVRSIIDGRFLVPYAGD